MNRVGRLFLPAGRQDQAGRLKLSRPNRNRCRRRNPMPWLRPALWRRRSIAAATALLRGLRPSLAPTRDAAVARSIAAAALDPEFADLVAPAERTARPGRFGPGGGITLACARLLSAACRLSGAVRALPEGAGQAGRCRGQLPVRARPGRAGGGGSAAAHRPCPCGARRRRGGFPSPSGTPAARSTRRPGAAISSTCSASAAPPARDLPSETLPLLRVQPSCRGVVAELLAWPEFQRANVELLVMLAETRIEAA